MDLKKYVKDRLNAILLSPSNEAIIPGAILDINWENGTLYYLKKIFSLGIYEQQYTVNMYNGHIGAYFPKPAETDYSTVLIPANLAVENITQSIKASNSIVLPQYGLDIKGLFTNETRCVMSIQKIKARIFKTPSISYYIFKNYTNLRQSASYSNYKLYEWLTNDLVVTEAYYATKITWTFDKQFDMDAMVNYIKAGNAIQDKLNYNQIDHKTFEISGEPTVPFAVKGIWLKEEK
jgi:hypothetical protein